MREVKAAAVADFIMMKGSLAQTLFVYFVFGIVLA